MADDLDISMHDVVNTMLSTRPVRSLDATFDGADERNLLDTIADSAQESPDSLLDAESVRRQVDRVRANLNGREEYVILRYFGLDGDEPLPLDQIGDQLGVTRERIRQIKERALSRLWQPGFYPPMYDLVI